ncbi:MAG: N-acetylmuramoyl-L-alanine amidase, partial [Spirochaetia bacterium]|nr:N-acetylmuramoyl-L-alanine amidase [Spirochaetia bacterium]
FVVAGHSAKAQGAMGYDGVSEHTRTVSLQQNVCRRLKGYAVEVQQDEEGDSLSEVADKINSLPKGWVAIDLHFNNNNPAATGCEVFVDKRTSEWNRLVAGRMVRHLNARMGYTIRRAYGYRDYKYTDESHVGSLYIVEKTIHPVILIEPCFLNKRDLAVYDEDIVAQSIIDAYSLPIRLGDNDPKPEKRV